MKKKNFFRMVMALCLILVLGSCDDHRYLGGDDSPVDKITVEEGYTLTEKSFVNDSVNGKCTYTDEGTGTIIAWSGKDIVETAQTSWTPTGVISYPTIWTIAREKKDINYLSQVKLKVDTTGLELHHYSLKFDNDLVIALEAASNFVSKNWHEKTIILPYFSFDSIKYVSTAYVQQPNEIVGDKEAEIYDTNVLLNIYRNSGSVHPFKVKFKQQIFKNPDVDDKLIRIEEDTKNSKFERRYVRTENYIKYVDTWTWKINRIYADKTEVSTFSKELNNWFEIPQRKKLYQDNLDFTCTKNWEEKINSKNSIFYFECGGQQIEIPSYWQISNFEYGGKAIQLQYHYFNKFTCSKYSSTSLGVKEESGTQYDVYLIKVPITGYNTGLGDKETFNVEFEVWKRKGGGGGKETLTGLDATSQNLYWDLDISSWVTKATLRKSFSNGSATYSRDTTVWTALNIFMKNRSIFTAMLPNKSVTHLSVGQPAEATSTRKNGNFVITTKKLTYTSNFSGFNHMMDGNNETAVYKEGNFEVKMLGSDITVEFQNSVIPSNYTEVSHDGKNYYRYTPTRLQYQWTYNQKASDLEQTMNLDIEKGITPPVEDKLTNLVALSRELYWSNSDYSWITKANLRMTRSNGTNTTSRDTIVWTPVKVSVSPQAEFIAALATKSISHTSIVDGSKTSSTRTEGNFVITTRNVTHISKFNGFNHNLTATDETVVFAMEGKEVQMLTSSININYRTAEIPTSSTSISYDGKTYDRYAPTNLVYNWTYSDQSYSLDQTMKLDVEKGSTPPVEEVINGLEAISRDLYWENSRLSWITKAVIRKKFSNNTSRDTTVSTALNISVKAQSLFTAILTGKNISNQSIGNWATTSTTTRNDGNFEITTSNLSATSQFDGFTHKLTGVNEKAVFKIGQYSVDMLGDDIDVLFSKYAIPNSSSEVSYDGKTYDRYTPTTLDYTWSFHGRNSDLTQNMNLDILKTVVPPVTQEDAWIIDGDVDNDGNSWLKLTVKYSDQTTKDTTVYLTFNNNWQLANPFEVIKADNTVSDPSFTTGTTNVSTSYKESFTIKTHKVVKEAVYDPAMKHNVSYTYQTAKVKIANKDFDMPSSDITPAYVNYSQSSGTVNGNYTHYPTQTNFTFTYNGHPNQATQEITIKVAKAIEPNLPEKLGDIDWAATQRQGQETVILKNGSVTPADRDIVGTFVCTGGYVALYSNGEVGTYAFEDGTSKTNEILSATKGSTSGISKAFSIAWLYAVDGSWSDNKNSSWLYRPLDTNGTETGLDITSGVIGNITTPLNGQSGYSYDANTKTLTITLSNGVSKTFKGHSN